MCLEMGCGIEPVVANLLYYSPAGISWRGLESTSGHMGGLFCFWAWAALPRGHLLPRAHSAQVQRVPQQHGLCPSPLIFFPPQGSQGSLGQRVELLGGSSWVFLVMPFQLHVSCTSI